MKKVLIKYVPKDRMKVLQTCTNLKNNIQSISITEGIFTFMRGTAIVEIKEENFNKTFEDLNNNLKSICSKGLKVRTI